MGSPEASAGNICSRAKTTSAPYNTYTYTYIKHHKQMRAAYITIYTNLHQHKRKYVNIHLLQYILTLYIYIIYFTTLLPYRHLYKHRRPLKGGGTK